MVITTTGLHLLTEMLPRENMRSYGQWPFCPPVTSLDNNYSAMPGRTVTRLCSSIQTKLVYRFVCQEGS